MSPKEIIKDFHNSNIIKDLDLVEKFYHKDCELHWNSTKYFRILKYNDILEYYKSISDSYVSLRNEISVILVEDNFVTVRHTVYARTIENQDEEIPLVHYITIWEIKDGKLFRGYQISQLADDDAIEANSFSEIKV
ncbi:nuclear transport factor 2 family protein [Bizionia arctica]|uniref:SnoaL-like domain-containing protein n=1 Tax=Bizionia arctica TaxID=1495645 RepID=A0A917GIX4_9FLAO|nr:nuclear transport factor 2 family protein [Bizionia arctica]GGG48290.1 hypothetical protein GCM10010976_19580 [Bizionia arctica]